MALTDFAPAHPGASLLATAIRMIGTWRAGRRAARAQRTALQSLVFMPQHRLNDLGLRREQLIQAMEIHRK